MSAIPSSNPRGWKPKIGSAYQPKRSEYRTATEYRALMPSHDREASRLQRALLGQEVKAYLVDGFWLAVVVAILGLVLFVGDKVGF